MRRYDVLLCDADDTIFDFGRAEENAFALACAQMGLEATAQGLACYSRINQALWQKLEQGGITQERLRVQRFEEYLRAVGKPLDAQRMSHAFMDALGQQSVLMTGALEGVTRWQKVLPIIVVTNGIAAVQHARMDKSPIRTLISGMVISEEVGMPKPNPRMIETALEQAGVQDRRRALMLGDSLSSDIAAANNAGVDACWLNRKGAVNDRGLQIAYEIAALSEVDAILRGERTPNDRATGRE